MSKQRKFAFIRLIFRILILIISILLLIFRKDQFNILNGWNFFKDFSVFTILWIIWIIDMILQIIPIKNKLPLGSQKLFANRFRRVKEYINKDKLKNYILATTKSAYKVLLLWLSLIIIIGILFFTKIIDKNILFLITIIFYVCDLICVLIWCPFRLIMKNKCCTTCRIYNWDHLMMFSPLIFINSFYTISLFVFSLLAFLIWELCILIFPERFWEMTNISLKCSECTDKLCIQYCQKIRNKNKAI